jgi:Zn-finger nucleic acid-binding protein
MWDTADKYYQRLLSEDQCPECHGAGEVSDYVGGPHKITSIHYWKCEECQGTGLKSGELNEECD